MKKFILGFVLGSLIFGIGAVYAVEVYTVQVNPFPILVNGVTNNNISALNINGFTWLQLADMKEVGIIVKFNETDRQIEITKSVSEAVYGGTNMNTITPTPSTLIAKELPAGTTYVEFRGCPAISYNGKIYMTDIWTYFKISYKGPDMWWIMESGKSVVFNRDTDTIKLNGTLYILVDSFSSLLE